MEPGRSRKQSQETQSLRSQDQLHPNMDSANCDHVMGIPVNSVTFAAEGLPGNPASASVASRSSSHSKQKKDLIVDWMSKLGEKAEGIRGHVSLGPKVSETMKGKLSMGARILQAGGVERVFRQAFSVGEGERLLKAFQCYLSTTAGPISGMLFISNAKIAFRSDRSLKLSSPKGGLVRVPYKVLVPLRRIKEAIPSQNMSKPNQKYIQIVTEDEFEFWFMGLVNYDTTYRYLRQAISTLQ